MRSSLWKLCYPAKFSKRSANYRTKEHSAGHKDSHKLSELLKPHLEIKQLYNAGPGSANRKAPIRNKRLETDLVTLSRASRSKLPGSAYPIAGAHELRHGVPHRACREPLRPHAYAMMAKGIKGGAVPRV